MDKNEKKYIEILSKDTEIPIQLKKQADLAYTTILSNSNKNENIKEYSKMKKKYQRRIVLLAAVLILTIGTTAFASVRHWGLADFFAKSGNEFSNQTSSLIETNVKQDTTKNTLVNFKIREAICDNKSVYVVLEARPVNPEKYMLFAMDSNYDDPVINMGIDAKEGETIVNYAKDTNREMIKVNASLSDKGKFIVHSADYTTEEDGTIVFILEGDNISKTENMTLTCNTYVNTVDMDGNYGKEVKDSFDFQLSNKSTEVSECYEMVNPAVVQDAGVIVDKIEVTKTQLGIYTELTYHIASDATDEMIALAKNSLWFEYLDDSGNAWKSGLSGIGSTEEKDDGVFVQKNNFSSERLPETVTVRAYDFGSSSNKRFGEVTLNRK